jgi:hypothetical protein
MPVRGDYPHAASIWQPFREIGFVALWWLSDAATPPGARCTLWARSAQTHGLRRLLAYLNAARLGGTCSLAITLARPDVQVTQSAK